MSISQRVKRWETDLRHRYSPPDIESAENRRKARFYMLWLDHEFLRIYWTNFFQIAPGVYRSNHPTRKRFEKMRDIGITHVINLRGAKGTPFYMFEEETCRELGLTLRSVSLHARTAPETDKVLALLQALRETPKPFVMHCKSGADRAGLASALYLLVIEGRPIEEAQRMLSPRYIHFKSSKTGILDHFLDTYAARNARAPIDFETWLVTEYDRDRLTASFEDGRRIDI